MCQQPKYSVYVLRPGQSIPTSLRKAVSCEDADKWWEALREEIGMLEKRGTWVIVDSSLPEGNRWTYALKFRPDGEINWYKARLVTQGFSQILLPGVDSSDMLAPDSTT